MRRSASRSMRRLRDGSFDLVIVGFRAAALILNSRPVPVETTVPIQSLSSSGFAPGRSMARHQLFVLACEPRPAFVAHVFATFRVDTRRADRRGGNVIVRR